MVIRHDVAMRFLFVGDSMTIGRSGDFTWRYRMWQHLRATLGDGGYAITGPRAELYDTEAGALLSHAYGDLTSPRPHAVTWRAGARAGSTWRPSSRTR